MLEEYKKVFEETDGRKRWFSDGQLDLVLWYEDQKIVSFQLCYDLGRGEHAITWNYDSGVDHSRIDTGEERVGPNLSPILVPNGSANWGELITLFRESADRVDQQIVDFVSSVLKTL